MIVLITCLNGISWLAVDELSDVVVLLVIWLQYRGNVLGIHGRSLLWRNAFQSPVAPIHHFDSHRMGSFCDDLAF